MDKINSYKDLIVWQRSMELVVEISKKLGFYEGKEYIKSEDLLSEVMKMLNKIINNSR